jgi:hypothetical protein
MKSERKNGVFEEKPLSGKLFQINSRFYKIKCEELPDYMMIPVMMRASKVV